MKNSEKIVSLWRFGYFKLFNDRGELENEPTVNLGHEGEWNKLFWRFYWRVV